MARARVLLGALLIAALLAGCGAQQERPTTRASAATPTGAPTSRTPSPAPDPDPAPSPAPAPAPGTTPPAWLGTRVLPQRLDGTVPAQQTPALLRARRFTLPDRLPPLPGTGFASRVSTPAPAAVIRRSTWQPGCPVAASDLSWLRLTFWGFDQRRHTGELLVERTAVADLVSVFGRLYRARFPIEGMRINTSAEQTAPPTGDGNDTSAFVCRATRGATSYSQHAYGLAVDVNPFQNPYVKGDVVLPELAMSYVDRGRVRPGMITPDGVVVRAFASIGWTWGGTWQSLEDLQHFSRNGR